MTQLKTKKIIKEIPTSVPTLYSTKESLTEPKNYTINNVREHTNENMAKIIPEPKIDKLVIKIPDDIINETNLYISNPKKLILVLIKNPKFLEQIDNGTKLLIRDNKIEYEIIPELIFLIIESYNSHSTYQLSYHELPEFVIELYRFILKRYKLSSNCNLEQLEQLVINSIKLVLQQPKIIVENHKCCKFF